MNKPRVLVVDDTAAVRHDFQRILVPREDRFGGVDELAAELFGDVKPAVRPRTTYQVSFASQVEKAIELVTEAQSRGMPFDLVFLDVRMPPGIDGVQAAKGIWAAAPLTQVVLCTAYSDYDWAALQEELGETDRLLILKKPFDPIEVQQLAASLTRKRQLEEVQRAFTERLEAEVAARSKQLLETEQRLQQAQRLRAVGQLASGVAHELNTPLQ